jgi:hypothetical protein
MALNQSVLWFNELAEIYHFLLVQGPQEWGEGGRHIFFFFLYNCPQWKTIYLNFSLHSSILSVILAIHFVVFSLRAYQCELFASFRRLTRKSLFTGLT